MSWLNLNQSLNSLKGQITNFASEVLSEVPVQDPNDNSVQRDSFSKELEEKCRSQELEIASLKKLTEELQASLQSEKLSRKNGIKEEESSWYWDPPPQTSKTLGQDIENNYKTQIRALQDELSTLKEHETIDLKPDTEEELNRLREENKNLTTSLEDLDNQHQLAMERLLTLKKELQKNFEVLKQEHEDLKNTNDEYAIEIQELLAKIGEKDKEIENSRAVKSDYDTLHHKYQNLEKIYSLLRENAEKFQEENQDLHEEVFKLQEQVTKLEHEIEIATKHSELSDFVPRERYDDLLKELNDLKERRNSNQIHLDEINIDDNAKSVIENLKRDINELKHKLASKEIACQDSSDSKTIKPERITQLYNKYVNFELPIDYVGEIPSSDNNLALYKLESVFKTLNSFKKEIDTLEHKLSEKNLNINHLQTQIDDLTSENDFLTTDIQHFERELNEMKKNNDFLISEIAALKNTSKLEPIIETHEDNLAKLETELADCNRINKTFENEIRRIEKELAEVQSEKITLQESLSELKQRYTSMLNELELYKNQTEAVEEFHNDAKYEELKKATDEINDLKKRLSATTTKNEQLSIDLHIIENDKVLLTKEIDDLKHALEEKTSAHQELEILKITLEHKLKDLENKFDEIVEHKMVTENEKLRLVEKPSILTTKGTSTDICAELGNITLEKTQLIENLKTQNAVLNETVSKLKTEISSLKRREQEILTENNSLKDIIKFESQNTASLQKTIEELKTKSNQENELYTEIANLKDEKKILIEQKIRLETELTSTDQKIVSFEVEFEKLLSDLNEKDKLIDTLNATITQHNINLSDLQRNIADLENSITNKNQEIESLRHSVEEISQQLNETCEKSNLIQEKYNNLIIENSEINKQASILKEEVNFKNLEIIGVKSRLSELERTCLEYKTTIDNKDKEIKELNQSILELSDKLKITDIIPHHNDDYAKLAEEKDLIDKEVIELKNSLSSKEKELKELEVKLSHCENTCLEYKTVLDSATAEKTELINLINLKHNESIQYHNEIQRLNHVILERTNEFQRIIEEKDKSLQNYSDICSKCEQLRISLKEKDEIIMSFNQNASEYDRVKEELLKASQTVISLTEKCEELERNLSTQLETVKTLTAEKVQLSEQEQNLSRELERLRHHLVEMEENYTQELMASEQKLSECQTRLHQVEEKAKQTSTVYTSNSIRANQEVETLRNQIKLLEKQREDVQTRLSEAEDARSRSEAALTNLQVVLEQFQLDKERDIQAATEKIRNKMEDLKRDNIGLQDEIKRLKTKLEEALTGLQAATRLGDQVETKTAQINDLKEQVRTLQTSVTAAEERYYNAISNQQDKVDKNLVKNLIINYVLTAANNNLNKTQVLRVLSTVLDFNRQECEKLGLVRSANTTESLAAEFVKFLQNESKPRAALPNMMGIAQSSSRSTTPTSRKSSALGPQPNPFEAGHKRNPSTGSNNLLFQNIDNVETSSQISIESDHKEPKVVPLAQMESGVNQTRNTEGAILKHVLKDM